MKNKRFYKKILAFILCFTVFASSLTGVVLADYHKVVNEAIANPTIFGSVYAKETYIAVGEGGAIYTSKDAAKWTKQEIYTDNDLNDIIFANNKFIIVGNNGTVLVSDNGNSWTQKSSGISSSLNAIIFEKNLFVAVGDNGIVLTSSNTNEWTQMPTNVAEDLHDIIYAKEKYIAVGNNGTVISSIAGNSWSVLTSNTHENLYTIATDESSIGKENSRILVGGENGTVLMSFNADSWSPQISPIASGAVMDMAFNKDQFVLVGLKSVIMTSADGISWTPQNTQSAADWYDVSYLNNRYFCFGESCTAASSNDAEAWTVFSVGGIPNLNQIIYVNNQFIAVGNNGTIVTSTDGNSWISQLQEVDETLNSIAYGDNLYVAVGEKGAIYTSTNGMTWHNNSKKGFSETLNHICFGENSFIAVGDNGTVLSLVKKDSDLSLDLSFVDADSQNDFNSVCYGDTKFVIAGDGGTILSSSGEGFNTVSTGGANLYDVAYIDNQFVAVGASHTVKYSSDAIVWNNATVDSKAALRGLAENKKIAVGGNSIVGANSVSEWKDVLTTKVSLNSVAYGTGKYIAVGEDIVSFIADITAPTITLREQSEYTAGNVKITVEIEDESDIVLQKWAAGDQSVDYFADGGTKFDGNTFEVPQNGVYTVYAKDQGDLETTATVNVTKQDTTPPDTPAWAEHYAQVNTQVVITWDFLHDSTLAGYAIYRDSVLIGTAGAGNTSYVDETPFDGSSVYSVAAFDKAGNYSDMVTSVYQSSMIIDGFYSGITAGDMRQKIKLNDGETVQIYNSAGEVASDSELIGTRTKIVISLNDSETETYLVALYGDFNGDGLINKTDFNKIKGLLFEIYDGRNLNHLVGDINNDHTINIIDLTRLQSVIDGDRFITQNRLCGTPERFSDIIDNQGPVIKASASQEWGTENALTISVTDTQSGVHSKTISDGTSSHDITGSTEIVNKNGIYTITAYDNGGNESVETVIVNHIIETETMGAYEKSFDDFEIEAKGIDIKLTRYYNSMNNETGIFGKRWQSTYEIRCVDYDPDVNLNLKKVIFPGEGQILFAYENGTYTSGTCRMKLTDKSGGYTLKSPEGLTYQFNSNGYLTSINDRIGNKVTLNLDSDGKIQSIVDSTSHKYTFEYGNNGLVSKVTDPAGRTFQYQYNNEAQLINYLNPLKTVTTKYIYNIDGYLSALRDDFGNNTESVDYLENSDRIKKITDANGSYILYDFDDEKRTETQTDVFGQSVIYTYDQYMQPLEVTGDGETTSTTYYNAYGDINTVTDSTGKTTRYEYDADGNVIKVTYTDGDDVTTEEYTYNENGDMLSSRDTNGNRKYYEYDSQGKIIREITPKNGTDVYDENLSDENDFIIGYYTYITMPPFNKGLLFNIYYDEYNYISYAYDNNGYVTQETTQDGITQYTYNVIGWLYSQKSSDSQNKPLSSYNYKYDDNHNTLCVTNGDDKVITRTVYDTYGRIKQIIEGFEYNDAYDGLNKTPAFDTYMDNYFNEIPVGTRYYYGNNEKLSSAKISEYEINYNSDNTVGNVQVQKNNLVSYHYTNDAKKLLTQTEYNNGQSVAYTYNDDGSVASIALDGASEPAFTYTYEDGEIKSKTDHLNNLQTDYAKNGFTVSKINADSSLTVLHKYMTDEELGTVTETVGSNVYTVTQNEEEDVFALNNGENITKSYVTNDDNTVTSISKTANDLTSTLVTATNYYDTSDQLSSLTTVTPNDTIEYTYKYANDLLIGVIQGDTEIYRYYYNEFEQLNRVDDVRQAKTILYDYDGARGNITAIREYALSNEENPTTLISIKTFTYGDSDWSHKLTAVDNNTITYDNIGNPLTYDGWTYVWEAGRQLKRMTKNGSVIDYKYDDNGIRISKTVNGTTTDYTTVDGMITGQSDGTHSMYFRYDRNGALVGLNLDGTEYLYLKNGQGDIEGILDTNGALVVSYMYDAWGKTVSVTGSLANTVGQLNPMRYRDYYLDSETGYYYLQSRYYNPDICRFINSDDPTVLELSFGNVREANLFAYCLNNPVMNSDPSGMLPIIVGAALQFEFSISVGAFSFSAGLEFVYFWSKLYKDKRSRCLLYFYVTVMPSVDVYQLKKCVNISYFRNKIKLNPKNLLAKPSINASVSLIAITVKKNRSFSSEDYKRYFSTTTISIGGFKTFKSSSPVFLTGGVGKTWGLPSKGLSYSKSYYWLLADVSAIMKNIMAVMKRQAKF